jgi:hypothetical protein
VYVAEVTQVNSIPACRQAGQYPLSPPIRRDPLHEVSGVKVPRPASSFITHETIGLPMEMTVAVSRGMCMDEFVVISICCVVE